MAPTTSCSLCSFTCNEFKYLFDDNGQKSAVYHVAVRYFNSSLLDSGTEPTLRVICLECWEHINNFHNFQEWIFSAQAQQEDLKLNVCEESSDNQLKSIDIDDFDINDASTTNSTKSILTSLDSLEGKQESDDDFITKLKGRLECHKCKKLCTSYAKLDAHFQRNHPNEQFYVICCNEKFNEKWNLVEHLLLFHNDIDENSFKCEECGASFSQYGNLRRHARKKHKVQPLLKWICKYCNKMFKSRAYLERHKEKIHTPTPQNTNKRDEEVCLEDFVTESEPEEMKVDSVYEANKNRNENDFMFKEFILESSMAKKDQPRFTRSSCNKAITLKEETTILATNQTTQIQMPTLEIVDIKEETSTDTESESDTNDLEEEHDEYIEKWKAYLKCPKCNKHAKSYEQLSEHFDLEHPDERCYINCCHITLNDHASILEHLRFHENPNAFECTDCGKCFKSSKGLNSHKLQVHSDNRSAYHLHLCYCKRAKELQAENKAKGQQTEYDTIVCCQRKKKILEDDALIAEWKKELTCEICKTKFSYYSLMRTHFYREHPGEKCYILCCQRKISRISDALQHIRFHLDPQAYRCKICNITFSGRSSLVKHMRNVHNDVTPRYKYACDECDKTFEIRQILTRHKNVCHSKQ